jgi:hypothetical protein
MLHTLLMKRFRQSTRHTLSRSCPLKKRSSEIYFFNFWTLFRLLSRAHRKEGVVGVSRCGVNSPRWCPTPNGGRVLALPSNVRYSNRLARSWPGSIGKPSSVQLIVLTAGLQKVWVFLTDTQIKNGPQIPSLLRLNDFLPY